MSFHSKYELQKLVLDGNVKTFEATEKASGRPVYLHLFAGESGRGAELIEKAEGLQQLSESPAGTQPVIEIGDGHDYIATEVLESFQGLETWVESAYEQAQERALDRHEREMRAWIASGNVAAALDSARQGALEFPFDTQFEDVADALSLLVESRRLAEQGNDAESLDRLREAVEIDPGNPLIRGGLLDALTRNAERRVESHPDEAAYLVQQALELDPRNPVALDIRNRLSPEREEFIEWCLTQSEHLLQQGDRRGARAVLDQGIAKYPDETRLFQGRANIEELPANEPQPEAETEIELQSEKSGFSTPRILVRQVHEGMRVAGSAAARLLKEMRRQLPAGAAWLKKFDKGGPFLPVVMGAGIAVIMIFAVWLMSDSRVEAEAPPPILVRAVTFRSDPAGAALSVNSRNCGTSACEVELEPGTHFAEATLTGYRTTIVSFDVDSEGVIEPVVVTLPPLAPLIRVSSDLASGTVELDGEPLGVLEDGEWERQVEGLSLGEHVLKVSASGATASFTFEMAPASLPTLSGLPETRDLSAVVVAGFHSAAKLHSDREITSVQLDGSETGDTATEWNDLGEGAHEIEVKTGGTTRKVEFDSLPSPLLAAFIQSDRNVGGLRIDAAEDGVAIFLNGDKYRRVTRRGRLLIYLYPKTYSVRVEKEGFRPSGEQTVAVRKGEQVALNFTLEPLPTTATLRIRDGAPGTQVLLDGNGSGVLGPDGNLSISNVEPGRHKVVLQKEGFKPREIEREFAANGSVDVSGALENAPGTLRIELTPANADVRLTLRREGESTERTVTNRVLELEAGTYTVSVSSEGFKDHGATIRLAPEETKTARIALKRIAIAQPAGPLFQLSDWEKRGGWLRQDDLLVRTGGNYFLAPLQPQPGVYEFAALVRKGQRLEWVVDFSTRQNHLHFQIGKDYFERSRVTAGRHGEHIRKRYAVDWRDYVIVRIDIRSGAVVTSLREQGNWTEIDRFSGGQLDLSDGQFGFYLPGRRQVGLQRLTFTRP
ncbi:MAG: PEGA domain-containing protein [Acidobacteria bacterium]|nr:PEGA domain-containing protein [Acidobacteriota bacterium]